MKYTNMHSIADIWNWFDTWNIGRSPHDKRHALSLKTQALIRMDRAAHP